jgi:hypothetical protein
MVEKNAQQYDSNDLNLGDFLLPVMQGIQGNFPSIEVGDGIEVSDDQPDEIIFVLDEIPGAPNAQEILIQDDDDDIEVQGDDPADVDLWKWQPSGFLDWLKKMFGGVPSHSGYDTTGLERAISYFEALDREITRAMRTDFKNEIDSAKAERAREQIEDGLERLAKRLEDVKKTKFKGRGKKSKAWAEETGIIKEAGTANITGVTITVPLLISRIARVCINGMVSAGHDIEDMFERQAAEYSLDKRERAELSQLLSDMGYPMLQDRGFPVGEPVEIWKNDNFDWSAQYRG